MKEVNSESQESGRLPAITIASFWVAARRFNFGTFPRWPEVRRATSTTRLANDSSIDRLIKLFQPGCRCTVASPSFCIPRRFLGNAIVTSYQYCERLPASHAEYVVSKPSLLCSRVCATVQGSKLAQHHFGPRRVRFTSGGLRVEVRRWRFASGGLRWTA